MSASLEDIDTADRVVVVAVSGIAGIRLFCTHLEHEYFPPPSTEFQILSATWHGARLLLPSIPLSKLALAKKSAKDCGMRLVRGVPKFREGDGPWLSFPLSKAKGYSLVQTRGSEVWKGDPRDVNEREETEIRSIIKRHAR